MDRIVNTFDSLANENIMARCTRLLSQNINESLHSRTFLMLKKVKFYKYHHVKFCAQMSGLIHNNGYANVLGSQYKRIGSYNKLEQQLLKGKDDDRLYLAGDKHQAKKKESRYANKPSLEEDKNIEYCAGYGFEDHEVSGAAEFDAIQNERESALAELEAFDAAQDDQN